MTTFYLQDIYPIIDNITDTEGGLECVISVNKKIYNNENKKEDLKYDAKTQFFYFTTIDYDNVPDWKKPEKEVNISINLSYNTSDIDNVDITKNIAMKIIKELKKPEFSNYFTVEYKNNGYELKRHEIEFYDSVNIFLKDNVKVKFTKELKLIECNLCEKKYERNDLFTCGTCYDWFCDNCFNGYEKRNSKGEIIDYEYGHDCKK